MITNKKSKKFKQTKKTNTFSNVRIIKILEIVKSYYAREKNSIHVNAYERAIYQLKKWVHPIKKGSDVAHLEGIGKGMIQKINTILSTGTLPIIQEKGLSNGDGDRTKKSLSKEYPICKVLGFSVKSAIELEKKYGIRSVRELEEIIKIGVPYIKLSKIQQMGLRYYYDLQEKIPRVEITQIGNKIEEILSRIGETGEIGEIGNVGEMGEMGLIVLLAGSYPSRLKKESKDIDILLVDSDTNKLKSKSYLEELVGKLKTEIPLETITMGANKFLGIVKLKLTDADEIVPKWRHLDMRLVDTRAFPYAWLYYSSGVIFNKMIREKLKKKGYKLNEWGLFHARDNVRVQLKGEKTLVNPDKDTLLEYAENIQKEIFKLAQLEYKTIQERY